MMNGQIKSAGEIRRENVANQILSTYMQIGTVIVKELDDMTVGERESLLKTLEGMEQTMACIGMKRLFVPHQVEEVKTS
jgi:hypothetical protein